MSSNKVRYAVLSHIIIDDIVHPDGQTDPGHLGGAGSYAAIGAALAASPGEVGIVAKVGAAERDGLSHEFMDRGISTEALRGIPGPTPRSTLRYFHDGERVEVPHHGEDHFDALTPLPADIPASWTGLEGIYLFHDTDPDYWHAISAYRAANEVTILWEISAAACTPEHWDAVSNILQTVDAFSINRTEALTLCGTDSLVVAVEKLRRTGVTVFLRLGEQGSVAIRGAESWAVAPARGSVVDPTGGGNSYSGAALVGFIQSDGHPAAASRAAAAAASQIIGQFGVPPVGPKERRRLAEQVAGTHMKDPALLLL
ncbi:carbohydrate kinase family protein [Arthrobacter sp. 35W]|uniref:carbohydrate kinase family protein n=1 Tax=Arthrobacter sp. 35W TaxID=1132441 RepID=UPI000411029F|nr:PfkB family carbohydrate kinase [Arthrobacter sp. 35W]